MPRIMIVDDEKNMLSVLELLFQNSGFETIAADSAERALGLLGHLAPSAQPDMVISDLRLPGLDGIEFLQELRKKNQSLPFVLITAYGTIEKAVEIMKLGAVDVLTKPFDKEAILELVARCLLNSNDSAKACFGDLVFSSPSMQEIAGLLQKIGPVSMPVLLTGESGTGKEVVARALHGIYAGGFDKQPFVAVNCPAVPESLLESELFGYRRGAFTGANQDFRGRVEQADGGTLFLDEIGDLPLTIQPKLLRLLENRSFEALGSSTTHNVDIRIICATNRKLPQLVREGLFREDLYYRINTFTLELPALRERPEDIPVLAEHFLQSIAQRLNRKIQGFSLDVMESFQRHSWPGNVRELRNVVERAFVLSSSPEITLDDIPADIRLSESKSLIMDSGISPSNANALEAHERQLIRLALESSEWNVSAAARELGISRNTLRYRMQKHGFAEISHS